MEDFTVSFTISEITREEFFELLCTAIHEGNPYSWAELKKIVTDIDVKDK